jgi:hypothetical protein
VRPTSPPPPTTSTPTYPVSSATPTIPPPAAPLLHRRRRALAAGRSRAPASAPSGIRGSTSAAETIEDACNSARAAGAPCYEGVELLVLPAGASSCCTPPLLPGWLGGDGVSRAGGGAGQKWRRRPWMDLPAHGDGGHGWRLEVLHGGGGRSSSARLQRRLSFSLSSRRVAAAPLFPPLLLGPARLLCFGPRGQLVWVRRWGVTTRRGSGWRGRRRGGDDRGGSEQGRKAPWWSPLDPSGSGGSGCRRDFPVLLQGRRCRRQNRKILPQEGIPGFWRCRCGWS